MRDICWGDPIENSPEPGTLMVESRGDDSWEFVYPRLTLTIYEYFENAIDYWRAGKVKRAEQCYCLLIADYPEFIDAYHHLAILSDETEHEDEACTLWQHAVRIGLDVFPEAAKHNCSTLPWSFLGNRPFLRVYHALALKMMVSGRLDQALVYCINLLDWSPDDNQGVRALAVDCYFQLEQPEGVLDICRRFPDDGMEAILYGSALALIQLGQMEGARKRLIESINQFPLIARELVKDHHRKPRGFSPDYIALWSPEQAYLYWKEQGSYWRKTAGALDLVREVLNNLPDQED